MVQGNNVDGYGGYENYQLSDIQYKVDNILLKDLTIVRRPTGGCDDKRRIYCNSLRYVYIWG